jgi:hypothetical protein
MSEPQDFETRLLDVGKCEPGIMCNILARLDQPGKGALRAASSGFRELLNSCVVSVAVSCNPIGRAESGVTLSTELATIFPNAQNASIGQPWGV